MVSCDEGGMKRTMFVKWMTILLVGVMVTAGCSDKPRVKLYIEGVADTANPAKNFIEADLHGSQASACSTIQETATVTLRVSAQGTIGPQQDVMIYSYTVNYFYFDPTDGQVKGPVALLAFTVNDVNLRVNQGTTSDVLIPVATFLLKTWSYGLSCFGIAGYSGTGVVDRMIAQITVEGETIAGKKTLSRWQHTYLSV